ncbi:MAG: tol-pal system protein YbgF [Alphaproteobacteria bacterium]|nr:tol-pal system protein YbgF [Alphaproteobacteria bacterium]
MIRLRSAVSVLAFGMALGMAGAPAHAQLFGPSDEEKARESAQDSGISDLTRRADQMDGRVQALENKVRSLTDSLASATGANEQLSHQVQLQNQKIDQMQKDFAYRICTLSAQQLGADAGSLNCAAAGSGGGYAVPTPQGAMRPGASLPPIGSSGGGVGPSQVAPNQTAYDDTPGRGRPPGVLGTLPADQYGRPAPSGPQYGGSSGSYSGGAPTRLSSLPPPPATPQPRGGSSQFDAAMNLLSKAQYNEAAASFQAYADANPDDTDLTPQAIYWVGNINYVQRNYEPAERSFAEVIKRFPKSDRAPEAMLKLAQSFLALGQKSEGCTTLGLIKSKYPQAPGATLDTAASLRRSSCR